MNNGYSLKLINHWKCCNMIRPMTILEPKKQVYIMLPFKGDSNRLMLKLKLAINRKFYAAQIVINEKTRCMVHQKPKQNESDCVTSHCVYQFTCVCRNTHIERNNHVLQLKLAEHIPKWLHKQMNSDGQIRSQDRQTSPSIKKRRDSNLWTTFKRIFIDLENISQSANSKYGVKFYYTKPRKSSGYTSYTWFKNLSRLERHSEVLKS
ncbi:unnamed protein product [Schistosoma spindalis]|nr:unnamed protein product [Schistosoma spindale]